jgi:hypothetical protein
MHCFSMQSFLAHIRYLYLYSVCLLIVLSIPEPPSYTIATSLPSYEEAEQTKQSEEDLRQEAADEEQQGQVCY